MSARRRVVLVSVVALALVAAACSTPAPTASNAVPAAAIVDDAPVVWAAFGGNETRAFDPASAWTQLVLARLPASAELVELATEDATVESGRTAQMAALGASARLPTVATIWFGIGEPGTSGAQFTASLTQLVEALQAMGVPQIVVVARPDDPPGRRYRYAAEAEAVARSTGVAFVSPSVPTGNPFEPAAQTVIADELAPVIIGA